VFEQLLAGDIRHERNVVLQCIRFITQHFQLHEKHGSSSELSLASSHTDHVGEDSAISKDVRSNDTDVPCVTDVKDSAATSEHCVGTDDRQVSLHVDTVVPHVTDYQPANPMSSCDVSVDVDAATDDQCMNARASLGVDTSCVTVEYSDSTQTQNSSDADICNNSKNDVTVEC